MHAGVAELVDAPDSKSGSFGSVGSIPTLGTTVQISSPLIGAFLWVNDIATLLPL